MINEIITVTVVCQRWRPVWWRYDDVFIAIQGVWWHGQARRTSYNWHQLLTIRLTMKLDRPGPHFLRSCHDHRDSFS